MVCACPPRSQRGAWYGGRSTEVSVSGIMIRVAQPPPIVAEDGRRPHRGCGRIQRYIQRPKFRALGARGRNANRRWNLLRAGEVTREFEDAHDPHDNQLPLAYGTSRLRVSGGQGFELMPLAPDRAAAAITQCFHLSYLNVKHKHVA
jgi:hypothetical protein